MLVRCEMAHRSAKGGMQVLVGACGMFVHGVMVHHSTRGRSFGQGEGEEEVSDKDEREMEPLNKPSRVHSVSTSCQMQPFSTWQGT